MRKSSIFALLLFCVGWVLVVTQPRAQLGMTGVGTGGFGVAAAGNVVTVDSANCNPATKQYKTSAATQTLTGVTITSGSNLALVVPLIFDIAGAATTPIITSLVWDAAGVNQALSLIVVQNPVPTVGPEPQLWGAVGITAGANKSITLTTTGSGPVFIDACAFTGVDQTGGATTFPNSNTGTVVTAPATINVTSAANHNVIAVSYNTSGAPTLTGTTIFNDVVSGSQINAFSNWDNGASTVAIGATSGLLNGIAAVDIKNAP